MSKGLGTGKGQVTKLDILSYHCYSDKQKTNLSYSLIHRTELIALTVEFNIKADFAKNMEKQEFC